MVRFEDECVGCPPELGCDGANVLIRMFLDVIAMNAERKINFIGLIGNSFALIA
jgi:hypothetical protein